MYHVLKDQINILQDYTCIGSQCCLCGKSDHIAGSCPRAHFILDRQEVIQQHLKRSKEFFKNFKRGNRQKYHALTKLQEVRKATYKITSFKNQMTTSMAEIDDLRKSRKQISGPVEEFHEGFTDDSRFFESCYPTLIHSNEDEMGIFRFKKEKKLRNNSRDGFNKSVTMKHQGEAAFVPLKMKIIEPQRHKIDEVVIDQFKNYEIYFPHNNITKVIEQMEYTRSKRKQFKTKLATEQDIIYFKARLGKLFDKTKRMGSSEILKSPQLNKTASKSPYVRQRSKSVREDNQDPSEIRKRSESVKTKYFSGV